MSFVPYAFAQVAGERQTPFRVAILPLTIHSQENLAFLQEGLLDMLSSRVELSGRVEVLEKGMVKKTIAEISGEVDTEVARKVGQTLKADFVIFGSLTKLGESTSLDLRVVEVKGEKPSTSVFVQAPKMEEIVAKIDDLARKVDEKILGYPLSPPKVEKPAEAVKEMAAIPGVPPGFRPVKAAKPEKGTIGAELWQSQSFPFVVKGMAIGDMDGDGRNEVALIEERNLYIYRWEKIEFKLLKKIDGARLDKYLAVDVGDIDKDGKAEIFVTNMQGDRLSSFVVAFRDGAFRVVNSGLDWYLRTVDWGEKRTILLGQKKGPKVGFEWPIYEMGWDGKGYKEIRKADLPRIFSIYGFTPFIHDGKTDYLFIDSNFRLKLMDSKGKVTWMSRDDYGSDNSFLAKPIVMGPGIEEGDEFAFVNVRVISLGNEILLIRNLSPIGQFFKRQKYYSKGVMQSLVWTGAMFMEGWKSQEISGYLADFQLQDIDGDGGKELIVAVSLPKESVFSGEKNSALMVSRIQ